MRKAIAALVVTVACLLLVVNFRTHGAAGGGVRLTKPAAKTASTSKTTSPPADGSASNTTSTARAPAPAPAPTLKRVDGADVSTQYGDVQVEVTMRNGRISDVRALLLPNDQQRSVEISQAAGPILREEALQAQSAQIDTVSGASFTSAGYAQSLQAALDRARGA